MKIIVCCDSEYGIGKDGSIPWQCPEDVEHFKETTRGHTLVMGRKTAESIPAKFFPFKNRKSIVITKSARFKGADAAISKPDHLPHIKTVGETFIIGGATIYDYYLAFNMIDEIIMTKLPYSYNCDVFFPIQYLQNFKLSKSYSLTNKNEDNVFVIHFLRKR